MDERAIQNLLNPLIAISVYYMDISSHYISSECHQHNIIYTWVEHKAYVYRLFSGHNKSVAYQSFRITFPIGCSSDIIAMSEVIPGYLDT